MTFHVLLRVIFVGLLIGSLSVQADEKMADFPDVLTIDRTFEYGYPNELFEYTVTPQQESTFPDESAQWQSVTDKILNFGFSYDNYWLRFGVNNQDRESVNLLLEIAFPLLDKVELYVFQEEQLIQHLRQGDSFSFHTRYIENENILFPLDFPESGQYTVYLHVQTSGIVYIPLSLYSYTNYIEESSTFGFLTGGFLGVLVALAIFNFLVFLYTRHQGFFYLSIFILSQILILNGINGQNFRLLMSDWNWMQQHSLPVFCGLYLFISGPLSISVLHIRQRSWQLALVRSLMAAAVVSTFIFILTPVYISFSILAFLAILYALSFLLIGVAYWRNGSTNARTYILIWLIQLGLFAFVIALGFGMPTGDLHGYNLLLPSSILTILLFSFTVFRRFSLYQEKAVLRQQQSEMRHKMSQDMQAEKIRIQEDYQEELEARIQESTFELEIALRELEEKNRELENLNMSDSLTQVKNRRYFDKRYHAELRRSRREESPLAIMILDIDRFKSVNDTYGHLVGDEVLRVVARLIKDQLKRVGDDLCRYGGEEFAVILPSTDSQGVQSLAETIRQVIESTPINTSEGVINITISIGTYSSVIRAETPETQHIDYADKALYQAKSTGRNKVCLYSDDQASIEE